MKVSGYQQHLDIQNHISDDLNDTKFQNQEQNNNDKKKRGKSIMKPKSENLSSLIISLIDLNILFFCFKYRKVTLFDHTKCNFQNEMKGKFFSQAQAFIYYIETGIVTCDMDGQSMSR